jgi:hypothetical protein
MSLSAIIADLVDQAETAFAGTTDRSVARAGLAVLIDQDYFQLGPADRVAVTAGVMAALEHEEFFGLEFVGNPFLDEPEPETD